MSKRFYLSDEWQEIQTTAESTFVSVAVGDIYYADSPPANLDDAHEFERKDRFTVTKPTGIWVRSIAKRAEIVVTFSG